MSDNPTPTPPPVSDEAKTFTQADVDAAVEKIAAKIKAEERRKVSERFADYDDLKAKAGGVTTAEERIAALEKQLQETSREALRRRVQAAHGIADEDADLFLTASDEETLTAQAKRLAERTSERKKNNNVVPSEGAHAPAGDSEDREFARNLFARANAD